MAAMVISAMTKEKVYTEGAALGIGIFNGVIGRSKPGAALLTTVITAAGGLFGSLMARGTLADVMEGVASGSLGALGYSIPFWIKSSPGTTTRNGSVRGIRTIQQIASPKALGGGVGRSPAPAYAEEFQNVELY